MMFSHQSRWVTGIGQLVHTDNTILRVFVQHVENEMAADKTGTAGDDDGHKVPSFVITRQSLEHSFFCGFERKEPLAEVIQPSIETHTNRHGNIFLYLYSLPLQQPKHGGLG